MPDFGLDVPMLSVTVDTVSTDSYNQKTYDTVALEIGAALADDGGYYARLPGSKQIDVLSSAKVTPLLEALDKIGSDPS